MGVGVGEGAGFVAGTGADFALEGTAGAALGAGEGATWAFGTPCVGAGFAAGGGADDAAALAAIAAAGDFFSDVERRGRGSFPGCRVLFLAVTGKIGFVADPGLFGSGETELVLLAIGVVSFGFGGEVETDEIIGTGVGFVGEGVGFVGDGVGVGLLVTGGLFGETVGLLPGTTGFAVRPFGFCGRPGLGGSDGFLANGGLSGMMIFNSYNSRIYVIVFFSTNKNSQI